MPELSVKKHLSGIIIEYNGDRIALDTGIPNEPTLLSHAHADHLSGLSSAACVFSTAPTFDTIDARTNLTLKAREIVTYQIPFSVRNVKVVPYNAGHVIGSAMFHLEFNDGMRLLYTGDFNVVDSLVHSAAIPIAADVLIMETTYGTPDWVFPPRNETHANIIKSAIVECERGKIPLFKAYSLGKAQEVIRLLQDSGFDVISGNHVIDTVSRVYEKYGVELNSIGVMSKKAYESLSQKCVIVSSSAKHTKMNLRKLLGIKSAYSIESRLEEYSLSGWTLGKYSRRGHPLSAHSDFPGLASFVTGVNPKME